MGGDERVPKLVPDGEPPPLLWSACCQQDCTSSLVFVHDQCGFEPVRLYLSDRGAIEKRS